MKNIFTSKAGLLAGAAFYAAAGLMSPHAAMASDAKPGSDAYEQLVRQAQQNVFTVLNKAAGEPVATGELLAAAQALKTGSPEDGFIAAASAVAQLATFTDHPDLATRRQAVASMADIAAIYSGDDRFTARTFLLMKDFDKADQDPSVRAAAMTAMARVGAHSFPALETEALQYRLKNLESAPSAVRQTILRDLGAIPPSDPSLVLPVLLRYAASPDPALAAAAQQGFKALLHFGPKPRGAAPAPRP
jgi:hypothetical protein